METFYEKLKKHLISREGNKSKVYMDTTGNLTAGIGHKLTPGELAQYKEGDVIPEDKINEWFKKDTQTAVDAAMKQGQELNINDENFLVNLSSVNFQLGSSWNKSKFPNAYKALKEGRYNDAITEINTNSKGEPSSWRNQTGTRVDDFENAIKSLIPAMPSDKDVMKEELNQVLSDKVAQGFGLDQAMYYGFNLRKGLNKEESA